MNRWKRGVVVVVVVLVLASSGVALYFSMPYHGSSSIQQVVDDPSVTVTTEDGVHVLAPANADSTVGVVFYPGARVAPDAYYSTFAPVVRQANVTVFVPEMPLNLALLDADAAGSVRSQHPSIRTWFVGGHSLGGVAACQYADSNDVQGLVLFASYCNDDVSDESFAVLSVTGSADTVLNRESYQKATTRLPPDSTTHEVQGMNHTQFGSYRGQRGDSPAPLSYDEAHRRLGDVLVPWLTSHATSAVGGDDSPLELTSASTKSNPAATADSRTVLTPSRL
ncbi:Alpha/beta hydrolase family protein [Halogranum rubrum]|uniref:Alpha/beta hydrolase family protein n=1 Tax=Halogranum rubrum TaxID=553466 RepID=A0A1I4C432_9EURY|nr:alpha/beta hydrolase [Halogranum rubrum]SFK75864.1 Alpha/beta hydrolase family protein [Halogranum rubrum]